jgi:phosphoglycerate dehydrogenase-like enzyme
VAEHALMLMIMCCKDAPRYWLSAKRGRWDAGVAPRLTGGLRELGGQTVGIIGFGNIGRLVARLLAGFGCRLLCHDTIDLPVGRQGELGARAVIRIVWGPIVTLVHVPRYCTRAPLCTTSFQTCYNGFGA